MTPELQEKIKSIMAMDQPGLLAAAYDAYKMTSSVLTNAWVLELFEKFQPASVYGIIHRSGAVVAWMVDTTTVCSRPDFDWAGEHTIVEAICRAALLHKAFTEAQVSVEARKCGDDPQSE